MSIPGESTSGTLATAKFDRKRVFSVMTSRARRKLLVALAHGGPQPASDLTHAGRGQGYCTDPLNYLDGTLKHLKVMVDAGIVVQLDHPTDKRRYLYALHPGVKVVIEPDDTIFDFGFLVARLSPDGD